MRIMEILTYEPDASTEVEREPGRDMMDQLAKAFTRDGLLKGLLGLGSVDQQIGPRARGLPAQRAMNAGVPTVPAVTGDNTFGSQSVPPVPERLSRYRVDPVG